MMECERNYYVGVVGVGTTSEPWKTVKVELVGLNKNVGDPLGAPRLSWNFGKWVGRRLERCARSAPSGLQ